MDGRIGDIFALQDKIVFDLTQGLNVALRGTEVADIERRETKSVEAYESFARGMMNLRLATRDSIERAISEFEEATRNDPEYAMAWAALGGAYSLKGSFLSIQDLVLKGLDMERRALALDPDLSDAHSWKGAALLMLGKVDEAIASIQEAIRLDPGNGQAHQTLARALWVGKGDFSAAIPVFERSIVLNPDAGYSYLQLGLLLSWERRYAEAERVLRRAVELQDQFISGNAGLQMVGANARLGYVYYLQGRYDDAIREYERGVSFLQTSDHALKERSLIELEVKLGRGVPPRGPHGEREEALRQGGEDVRGARRQRRRRSVHALLHRRPPRTARRCRSGLRLSRARLRRAARTHGRTHAPRPRSRVAERRSAFRPFRRSPHRARRGVNAAGTRRSAFGTPVKLVRSASADPRSFQSSRHPRRGSPFAPTAEFRAPSAERRAPSTDPVCVSSIGPVLFVPQDR